MAAKFRRIKNKKLIRFLRDDLGLLYVKDGCSEGACGTCTILMDGRNSSENFRSCLPTKKIISKLK
ncbi:MAG: 2Fe-2S iron-sulfur cluster binding domain-containing protein [Synergistaceae bacterium]|nr:2Fe-2S iron-sulfur cluster binding domain-containing protein [Synergistaceae bacterium]